MSTTRSNLLSDVKYCHATLGCYEEIVCSKETTLFMSERRCRCFVKRLWRRNVCHEYSQQNGPTSQCSSFNSQHRLQYCHCSEVISKMSGKMKFMGRQWFYQHWHKWLDVLNHFVSFIWKLFLLLKLHHLHQNFRQAHSTWYHYSFYKLANNLLHIYKLWEDSFKKCAYFSWWCDITLTASLRIRLIHKYSWILWVSYLNNVTSNDDPLFPCKNPLFYKTISFLTTFLFCSTQTFSFGVMALIMDRFKELSAFGLFNVMTPLPSAEPRRTSSVATEDEERILKCLATVSSLLRCILKENDKNDCKATLQI